MMRHWIIFFILIVTIIYFAIKAYRKVKGQIKKISFLKETLALTGFMLFIYVFDKEAYTELQFLNIEKGFTMTNELFSIVVPIFFIPVIVKLFDLEKKSINRIASEKSTFGFPTYLLPTNYKEFLYFTNYIIIGVIFEEFVSRQFLFYYFFTLFRFQGDGLVVLSSILFAVPHIHQGQKGVYTSFILGLILGKIFLITGNIYYCVILHLALNATIIVIAWKNLNRKG